MDIKKILFRTNEIDVEKSLPDAIIYCNKEGKIQWVNDKTSEIFDTSKMHLLTSNITDFLETPQILINIAISTNEIVLMKYLAKEIYFEVTAKEVDGGYVLSFRKSQASTSIKENPSEEEIQKVNRDKNSFLVKIANDFKSPLQSIVGFSQAIADGLGGEISEQQDKYIRIIKKNSSDLMYFVNKLIDLSITELDNKILDLKIFDINNLINSVVKFNEQLFKDKDLRWKVCVEEGIKNTIFSDEEILKSVLQNLLEVIVKSVDIGEIQVDLTTPSDECIKSKNLLGENFVLLSVSSSSLLLSESDLESMFDPYKIIDTPNKKNLLRAMTLACVKNLVQSLNGVVWIESEILKKTSFNIIIPQGKV